MKAPDKIYITVIPSQIADRFVYTTCSEDCPNAEKYIRKDALLEKLEKVAAEYKKRSDEGQLVWQNMCGIEEAIDILNKM